MSESTRLFLIDGHALAYRAYFAFIRNPLVTKKGESTSAIYGFVSSLSKIIREENPTHLAVVFDTPKPTFRHEMFSDYKATRAKMPDDMISQMERLREVLVTLEVPTLELDGYEADDVVGTIARQCAETGTDTVLVTGDKDYMQLVNDHVTILNPKKSGEDNEWLDREGVTEKFGVPPEQVIEVLALMGDSSDNVPGVAGVGPKTALKLIEEHGTVEKLYEKIDSVKAKGVREKLERDHDRALLSRKLVTIDTNVPIEWDIDSLVVKPVKRERIEPLFRELELNRLLNELAPLECRPEEVVEEEEGTRGEYRAVTDAMELKEIASAIHKAGVVAIDTETTGLDPLTAELVGICLSWEEGAGVYLPIAHTDLMGSDNIDLEAVKATLGPALADKSVKWVAQNAKYDWHILERAGFDLPPFVFDTMLAAYVLDPSGRHGLNSLALDHCGHRMIPISDLIGSGKKQKSFAEVPVADAAIYGAEDADFTLRLYGILSKQVTQAKLTRLLEEVEQPLVRVLMDMESAGVALDVGLLAEQSAAMARQLETISAKIEGEAGHPFNLNSTQQLSKVLFEEIGLKPTRKTAKGTGYSTNQTVLEELAPLHPLPGLILEYRELQKLKSTYIDALPKMVGKDGRVHTSFNQTVASTGRLSSQDPNLQNIPIRTETGRQIRKAFVPRDVDHVLLAADYSQVELRVLAHIAGDETLREAFANDEDVHRRTAAAVYDVSDEEVTREMRAVAKTANFAIIYGVSAFGLAQQTDLSVSEARDFIDTYFQRYPSVKQYIDLTIEQARTAGYVTTLLGRRRFLPEIHAKNRQQREFAERIAVNTPIQGTAADLIKVAMIDIHKRMAKMRSKMVLQVHDELVFDAHKDEIDDLQELVRDGMEHAIELDVPLKVDMGVGANWLEAK